MSLKAKFSCPQSMVPHARKVLAGEYDVPGFDMRAPRVLDIGANVGAFAIWAMHKWPECEVTCYEPHPENIAILRPNLHQGHPSIPTIVGAAVFADGQLELHEGRSNCGEHSLWRGPEQSEEWITVPGVSPTHLEETDFLKVDAEGAELGILAGYLHLETVKAVALETHSVRDAHIIRILLADVGLTLVSENRWRADRSVQKWLRSS
jgi:FkbM family methyltransferase